jgi:hypothetical protein
LSKEQLMELRKVQHQRIEVRCYSMYQQRTNFIRRQAR